MYSLNSLLLFNKGAFINAILLQWDEMILYFIERSHHILTGYMGWKCDFCILAHETLTN